MLRKTIQRKISNTIAQSSFSIDDFHLDFSSHRHYGSSFRDDRQRLAKIEFKHEAGYKFLIIEHEKLNVEKVDVKTNKPSSRSMHDAALGISFESPFTNHRNRALSTEVVETKTIKELESKYDIEVSPGEEKATETTSVLSLDNIQTQLKAWLHNLKDELTVDAPDMGESESKSKIKEELSKHLESYIDNKESRFTQDEVVDISNKMKELVEAVRETQILLETEINELKKVIDDINGNLKRYKKGTWYETTLNRLSQWASGAQNIDKIVSAIIKIGEKVF